jgi:hypothetical protein
MKVIERITLTREREVVMELKPDTKTSHWWIVRVALALGSFFHWGGHG